MKRQIIAIGDNSFRKDPADTRLIRYLLAQAEKEKPKVAMVPTASGDAQDYIDAFTKAFQSAGAETSVLSLFRGHTDQFAEFLLNQDVIYVSGGNTRNMLTLWRDWGVDSILRKAYEKGVVLAGGSAGSICWFESGVTDSIPNRLTAMACLGWLKGSSCPHYDAEINRRPRYHELLTNGEIIDGIANDEGVGIHYVNEQRVEVVTMKPGKSAYLVRKRGSEIEEIALSARVL